MAAAAAEGDGSPPEELRFYWNFKRYGNPEPGKGWHDWPMGLPQRAAILDNVHNAFSSRRSAAKKSKWADSNPDMNDIFTRIIKLRKDIKRRGNRETTGSS